MKIPYDVPPTAGLPLRWTDLFGARRAPELDRVLAAFLGVESVGIACSGTASLIVVLETLRQRSDRRTVVIPAYTCPLVPLAVALAGLRVKLCDLSPGRFDFDPDALAAACDADTLAVLPTHLAGLATDLEPVLENARRVGALVVEDAAQAFGATWQGRPVGTIGDVGVYSLSRGKGLTVYEGGFWATHDEELGAAIEKTAERRLPFRSGIEALRVLQMIGYRLFYNPLGLPYVYGFELRRALARRDFVAAAGDEQRSSIPLHRMGRWRRSVAASALSRLASATATNALRGRERAAALAEIPHVAIVDELANTEGTWPFLMLLADSEELRDRIMERLWSEGLGVNRVFIHDLTGYDYLEPVVPRTDVRNARSLAARSFTISNSEFLSDEGFRHIRDVIARTVGAAP